MKIFNIKYIPLTIVMGFNLFTLFIFYTAPIEWKTSNLWLFLIFSITCQILMVSGYRKGFKKYLKKKPSNITLNILPKKNFNFIFVFYCLTFLIKYAYLLRFQVWNVKGMVNFLLVGIADSQIGYSLSLDTTRPYTISWIVYFAISIVNHVFFIVCFIRWKQMTNLVKGVFIFFVIVELFYWMGRGTNFGVITMITTFIFSAMYRLKYVKLNFRKIIFYSTIVIALLITSISIFSLNMNKRRGNSVLNYDQFDLGASQVNENSVAFAVVPKSMQDTYMYVVSYLSQGYYHTCLAFDLDFKPCYFLGNNPALIDFAKLFGIDVWKKTYMYRLSSKGVDPLINWHSAYTWFASDISFLLVPILLYFMGYVFGSSWAFTLSKNDFLSNVVFVILGNMLLYLFANNTYLSSIFYSFMFIFPIWYFTRIKRLKIN